MRDSQKREKQNKRKFNCDFLFALIVAFAKHTGDRVFFFFECFTLTTRENSRQCKVSDHFHLVLFDGLSLLSFQRQVTLTYRLEGVDLFFFDLIK